MLVLSKQDAEFVGQVFIDYYANFDRIDDYLRKVKLEKMAERPSSLFGICLLYTSPSPRDLSTSRMPSSA